MNKIILALLIFASTSARASMIDLKSQPEKGAVHFETVARPGMVKIIGEAKGPVSEFTIVKNVLNGQARFFLNELDTKIGMRNEHMKEKYLEVQKYPETVLKIKDLKLPDTWTSAKTELKDFPFKGTLTLHGVDKEVTGTLNVSADMKLQAHFEIKVTDYKIERPAYLMIKVDDAVKVDVQINEFVKSETVTATDI